VGAAIARFNGAEPERAGFWDQEDPWGLGRFFRHAEEHDRSTPIFVAGPWFHGHWQSPKEDSIGLIPFAGHETARGVPGNIEAPFFFRVLLARKARNQSGKPARFRAVRIAATLTRLGTERGHGYDLYLARDGTPLVHCTWRGGRAKCVSQYVLSSKSVPYANAHFADVSSRRLAHLGMARSAFLWMGPPMC